MHDRGLKLGIYGDMGSKTCEDYPGTTLDRIETDAQTFAEWEVDMFKFDGCHSNPTEHEQGKNRSDCIVILLTWSCLTCAHVLHRIPAHVKGSKCYRPSHRLLLQLACLPGGPATKGIHHVTHHSLKFVFILLEMHF